MENSGKAQNDIFRIYDGTKIVSKFGTQGNGPEDFILPMLNSDGRNETNGFSVIDHGTYKHITLENGKVTISNNEIPQDFLLANTILQYNDSVITVYATSDYQIQYYDRTKDTTERVNYFDKSNGYEQVADWNCIMTPFRASFSYTSKYAIIAYQNFKKIDIVSLEDRKSRQELVSRIAKRICLLLTKTLRSLTTTSHFSFRAFQQTKKAFM